MKPFKRTRVARHIPGLATFIHELRDQRVMLSTDLGPLYGVPPKVLVQAVKRNRQRFPADFMFQLSAREFARLKSQIVTSNRGGLRRALPYAFTEQGVAMLSSVLRSSRAIAVNIAIMRTFVRLRVMAASVEALSRKLTALEKTYEGRFRIVFDAIRGLMAAQGDAPPKRIGFRTG